MKSWIVLALAIGLAGCALSPADKPIAQSEREFSQVYDIPGVSKGEIYEGSLKWIAENFKSAKSVIEYQNPTDGVVIGNGIINYPCSSFECIGKASWRVKFTMKLETKDGKFKTEFKNLLIDMPATVSEFGSYPAMEVPIQLRGDLDAIKPKLILIGDELKAGLSKKSSDW